MAGLDDRIDELYAMPPEEFIAARNALATELKAAGDERAAEVKALRRPSVAAWAVNSLAREEPTRLNELVEAGRAMRTAQGKLLKGRGAEDLEEAAGRRRRLVVELARRAGALLRDAGRPSSATLLDAVEATLLATATDEVAAKHVLHGRLEKELPTPAGFGGLIAPGPADEPPAAALAKKTRKATVAAAPSARERRERERARGRADEAGVRAEEAEAEAGRLREAATAAERAAAEAAREADRARRAADRARAAAERAANRAADLRERADRARAAVEKE